MKEFEEEILNKEMTIQELDAIEKRILTGKRKYSKAISFNKNLISLNKANGNYKYHVKGRFLMFYLDILFDVIKENKEHEKTVIKVTEIKRSKDMNFLIGMLVALVIIGIIYGAITYSR